LKPLLAGPLKSNTTQLIIFLNVYYLKVCLVKADGPMVNLYATVATEALTEPGVWHCDDG